MSPKQLLYTNKQDEALGFQKGKDSLYLPELQSQFPHLFYIIVVSVISCLSWIDFKVESDFFLP